MKRRVVIFAIVAVGVAVLLATAPARALPPVSWQPEPFDAAVPPGGRLRTKVTATISQDLPATRVQVTPSLAPFLTSIEPATLPALTAGSQVTINLIFEVATGTPHAIYEGTLHLRQATGKDNGTQARPLEIVLMVGDLLYPPDPGEVGEATLEGIDSDADGVRDDLQRYIEIAYSDAPVTRAALRQYVVPLQAALLDADSEEAALKHDKVLTRADDCLQALIGLEEQAEAIDTLIAEALNTEARSRAYILHDSQLGGHVFSLRGLSEITPALCDFDIEALGGVQ